MILRRLAALILLLSIFAVVRPVLACENMDTRRGMTMKAASFELNDELNDELPVETGSEDSSHSDLSLDEIADLTSEFHFFSFEESKYSVLNETADSTSVSPLLRPPAARR